MDYKRWLLGLFCLTAAVSGSPSPLLLLGQSRLLLPCQHIPGAVDAETSQPPSPPPLHSINKELEQQEATHERNQQTSTSKDDLSETKKDPRPVMHTFLVTESSPETIKPALVVAGWQQRGTAWVGPLTTRRTLQDASSRQVHILATRLLRAGTGHSRTRRSELSIRGPSGDKITCQQDTSRRPHEIYNYQLYEWLRTIHVRERNLQSSTRKHSNQKPVGSSDVDGNDSGKETFVKIIVANPAQPDGKTFNISYYKCFDVDKNNLLLTQDQSVTQAEESNAELQVDSVPEVPLKKPLDQLTWAAPVRDLPRISVPTVSPVLRPRTYRDIRPVPVGGQSSASRNHFSQQSVQSNDLELRARDASDQLGESQRSIDAGQTNSSVSGTTSIRLSSQNSSHAATSNRRQRREDQTLETSLGIPRESRQVRNCDSNCSHSCHGRRERDVRQATSIDDPQRRSSRMEDGPPTAAHHCNSNCSRNCRGGRHRSVRQVSISQTHDQPPVLKERFKPSHLLRSLSEKEASTLAPVLDVEVITRDQPESQFAGKESHAVTLCSAGHSASESEVTSLSLPHDAALLNTTMQKSNNPFSTETQLLKQDSTDTTEKQKTFTKPEEDHGSAKAIVHDPRSTAKIIRTKPHTSIPMYSDPQQTTASKWPQRLLSRLNLSVLSHVQGFSESGPAFGSKPDRRTRFSYINLKTLSPTQDRNKVPTLITDKEETRDVDSVRNAGRSDRFVLQESTNILQDHTHDGALVIAPAVTKYISRQVQFKASKDFQNSDVENASLQPDPSDSNFGLTPAVKNRSRRDCWDSSLYSAWGKIRRTAYGAANRTVDAYGKARAMFS